MIVPNPAAKQISSDDLFDSCAEMKSSHYSHFDAASCKIFIFSKILSSSACNPLSLGSSFTIWSFSRVWLFFIRNPRQIIHARFKGYGKFSALLKGIVSFPIFQLGIITLIDAGHHLYFYLRISLFFPQFFQSVHVITQSYYVKFPYWNYGDIDLSCS